MKNAIFIFILCATAAANAGQDRGGGDVQCDALIKSLAGNLLEWIVAKGPEAGKLNLTSTLNPATGRNYTVGEYETKMAELLRLPLDVSCVKPGDKGYPVSVGNAAKICATEINATGLHMTCDRDLFLKLSPDLQIEQDHHEFAINLAGLEPDHGAISTYKISLQLANSIDTVNERRLVVNPAAGERISSYRGGFVCAAHCGETPSTYYPNGQVKALTLMAPARVSVRNHPLTLQPLDPFTMIYPHPDTPKDNQIERPSDTLGDLMQTVYFPDGRLLSGWVYEGEFETVTGRAVSLKKINYQWCNYNQHGRGLCKWKIEKNHFTPYLVQLDESGRLVSAYSNYNSFDQNGAHHLFRLNLNALEK